MLDCVKLVQNPTLYASFLLWMLSELFESLPEAGDLEKPKLVFFFDEAHTLFRDAPAVLVQKIEQTVKLIRSKGVGVFFVMQSPSDIPDAVLAQLSNRVQHTLRAYTPAELKAVRVAAQAFRANPAFRAEDAIMELGVGEALTSFLNASGVPAVVQRTKIVCPQSLMGAPEPMARMKAMLHDGMEKYDDAVDNLSAYEVLTEQADARGAAKAARRRTASRRKGWLRRRRRSSAPRRRPRWKSSGRRRKPPRKSAARSWRMRSAAAHKSWRTRRAGGRRGPPRPSRKSSSGSASVRLPRQRKRPSGSSPRSRRSSSLRVGGSSGAGFWAF